MAVGKLHLEQRSRVALIGTLALLVALIATAFALGGSGKGSSESAGSATSKTALGLAPIVNGPIDDLGYGTAAGVPLAVPSPPSAHGSIEQSAPTVNGGGGASSSAGSAAVASPPRLAAAPSGIAADAGDSSLAATKIVKTGELAIRVTASEVKSKVADLSALATTEGGYVASSNTDTGGGVQSGEVVLRVPVDKFSDAITKASALGHQLSLTTSANDVTGHYVDLAARKQALEQTRATYLTILGRARTIGATLEVQDRIEDVQSQIDQLTGELKVLSSQASYSTLTVDVTTDDVLAATVHHHRHGLSKAWHTSWSRFSRGIDAIVGAIGPIVLALLIMAAVAGVCVVGYRGVRRVAS